MGRNIDDIDFGLLNEYELSWLQGRVKREIEKREEKPEEYMEVVYANDGSEGFYCPVEKFHLIPSDQLHGYIAQTLTQGSTISFSVDKVEINDYKQNAARYEWNFADGSNTEVIDEDDDEEESDQEDTDTK